MSVDIEKILDAPAGAIPGAIRHMLADLLIKVWDEGEEFDGKRPFGNSGWQFEVYAALITAGLLAGNLDEDGYLESVDSGAGDKLITDAVKYVFGVSE